MPTTLENLAKLPVPERIQLVEDLWDTIARDQADVPVSDAQLSEIERRRAELLDDPTKAIPWSEAKARLLARQP